MLHRMDVDLILQEGGFQSLKHCYIKAFEEENISVLCPCLSHLKVHRETKELTRARTFVVTRARAPRRWDRWPCLWLCFSLSSLASQAAAFLLSSGSGDKGGTTKTKSLVHADPVVVNKRL